jgi:hypothetical protein
MIYWKKAQTGLKLAKSSPKRGKIANTDCQIVILAKTDQLNKYFRRPKRRQWDSGMCLLYRSCNTVVALSIPMANFGWAHPNRVVSQAVFQIYVAGHPKFGAEREVRS